MWSRRAVWFPLLLFQTCVNEDFGYLSWFVGYLWTDFIPSVSVRLLSVSFLNSWLMWMSVCTVFLTHSLASRCSGTETHVCIIYLCYRCHFQCVFQSGLTSLHLAAQEDKVGVGEILVKHGGSIDQQTKVRDVWSYPKTHSFKMWIISLINSTLHSFSWDTHLWSWPVIMETPRWLIFYWKVKPVSTPKQRYRILHTCQINIYSFFV